MTERPTHYPEGFSLDVLELAVADLQIGHCYPLNPRNRNETDYRNADSGWLTALNLFLQWRQYFYDQLKPKSKP